MNPLITIFRNITDWLKRVNHSNRAGRYDQEDLATIPVAPTSQLAFFFVVREHYTELGGNTPWAELWRLVTILICVLPTYSKYFNPMVPQMQLLQPICYEGTCEQYRYKLDERDWEDFLLAQVRCFEVGHRRDSPPPPYEDIFAIFTCVYMALPVDGSWDSYLQGKDFTPWRRLGYMDASVDTPAYQLAIRLRLAEAYRTNPKFRNYLETVEARKAMMVACVRPIYTHGIKCANASNRLVEVTHTGGVRKLHHHVP